MLIYLFNFYTVYCIGGVMVSLFTSSVVDREFDSRTGQTKDYEIGICCFSAKYTMFRSKSSQKQNNVSEWSNVFTHRLLFQ